RGKALQLEGRDQQQCGRGLCARPAQETRRRADPQCAGRRLHGAAGMIRALTGSLRARLLWFLLAAIVLAAGAQALVAYRTVLNEADEIFHHHNRQMALSLRAGLPHSAAVGGLGAGDENFEFIVQVWTL